jgi:hypothetical protein
MQTCAEGLLLLQSEQRARPRSVSTVLSVLQRCMCRTVVVWCLSVDLACGAPL